MSDLTDWVFFTEVGNKILLHVCPDDIHANGSGYYNMTLTSTTGIQDLVGTPVWKCWCCRMEAPRAIQDVALLLKIKPTRLLFSKEYRP